MVKAHVKATRGYRGVIVGFDATPLLGVPTGVARFTGEALDRLSLRPELQVKAFTISWRGRGQLVQRWTSSVQVVRRPAAARPLRRLWARGSWPPIEWWTGPIDVVHGPNFVVPPARHAGEVVSVHDLSFLFRPELCNIDTVAYDQLLRRAVDRGAFIHTIDVFVDPIIGEFGARRDRVVAIPYGVPPVADVSPSLGRQLATADRFVLALGTVEPRKDLPTLIAAFDLVADADPDVRLVIAGPDGWRMEPFVRAQARAVHRDRIVRLAFVAERQRAALLRAATVVAQASVHEGFSFVPLEAMAVGTPVVATAVGGVPDSVGDAALLVPPDDPVALAGALHNVLSDERIADELALRGAANVNRFSWDHTIDALVDLYVTAAAAR